VNATTLLLFALMEFPLCLTPGPAVLFVFAHGLRYGAAKSLWANLGILTGNAFYFILSATGLAALVKTSHDAFLVVKWIGAGYLVFVGLRMIFSKASVEPPPSAAVVGDGPTPTRILTRGIVLQLANPKALVFFTAFLPQFVAPNEPIGPQMLILGLTSTVIELFVLAGYGYFASRLAGARIVRHINWISGGMLVACGTGLALTSVPPLQTLS
jgi:homoserine/homoserine lactone efflux protein